MRGRSVYWLILWLLMVALVFLSLFALAPPAMAEGIGVQILGLRQDDLDGDSRLDVTIIDCSFATALDRVYVYDRDGDMRAGDDWKEMTDFINDTWVFDVAADGSAQLIAQFSQEEGRSVVYFYDDRDGDGRVSYQLSSNRVEVTESAYWTLKVESDGSWFLPDGSPNLNLRFLTDGYLGSSSPAPHLAQLRRWDGKVDFESEVIDADDDGIPEYAHGGLLAPSPRTWAIPRHSLQANEGQHKPAPPDGYLFWPFLGGAEWYRKRNYFDSVPSVSVDWDKARVAGAGLYGYPIEAGYAINNLHYWQKGQVNYADFENPMAYYDLTDDQDGRPELHIRMAYFGPRDPYLLNGTSPVPVNDIRYSWNQRNSSGLYWDYKLGLAGMHLVDSVVWFDDFGVQMIPYEELPDWVVGNSWAWGTLVAAEGANYQSSEGIYEWTAAGGVVTDMSLPPTDPARLMAGSEQGLLNYLTGRTTVPPANYYTRIRPGFRGEFAYLQARPYLYFSPIDAKLHLLKATHGVWNIDGTTEVRYANLDNDAYLDQWQYLEEGELRRQLNFTEGYLLYMGDGEVLLKQADVRPSLFETLPPRNHKEWLALGQRLEANRRDFAPSDFKAMMAQFDGPEWHVEGATLRDYRPIGENGFRFVLELQPTFRWSSQLSIAGAGHLQPGRYLLSFNGQGLAIRPLTPPNLILGSSAITLSEDRPKELTPVEVNVTVRNEGLEDANSVLLQFDAWRPGQPTERIGEVQAMIPGEETQTVSISWAPLEAGAWTLSILAVRPEGTIVAEGLHSVEVAPMPGADWDTLSRLMSVPSALVLIFVSLAATAAATFGLVLSSQGQGNRRGADHDRR